MKAIRAIGNTLLPLPMEARSRVLRWALDHVPDIKAEIIRDYERDRRRLSRTNRTIVPDNVPDTPPIMSRTMSRTRTKVSNNPKGLDYTPGFESFWSFYPKRVGKGEAFKAWTKSNCEVITEVVVQAVREQNGYLIREGGKFIPLPATWLNQKRWQDEPPKPSPFSDKTAGNAEALRRAAIRLKGGDPDAAP